MGCTKCGTDHALTGLLIDKAINDALKDGTLQGGLYDCGGKALPAGANVVRCEELAGKICELMDAGELCLTLPVTMSTKDDPDDSSKLILTIIMSDATEISTKIPKPSSGGGSGIGEEEVKKIVNKAVTDALKPVNTKIADLERRLDELAQHNAGIKLVDGTGEVDLAFAHEAEDM